jgi:DNA primase
MRTVDEAATEANFGIVKGTIQCWQVAEEETVLRPSGKHLRGKCPLPEHDGDSPSFYCYDNGGGFYDSWYCHRCSRGGDVVDLNAAMRLLEHNLTFAMQDLAERYGVKLQRDVDVMSETQLIVRRARIASERAFAKAVAEHFFATKVIPLVRGVEDERERAALLRRCIKYAGVAR